jgi:uncharacterized protein (TIGR03435 family)
MIREPAHRLLFGAALAAVIVGYRSAPLIYAQARAESRATSAFDTASIKPRAWKIGDEGRGRARIEYTPVSLTMWNVGLQECVQWAYGAKYYQLAGPSFHSNDGVFTSNPALYDIVAKPGREVAVSQLRMMLQDLLAKRFKLALHRETKMLPVYELVVTKGGPKLPSPKPASDLPPSHAAETLPGVRGGDFVFQNTTIAEFAEKLGMLRTINQPVVDRTGISGVFDITLKSAASANLDPDGPSLFTLVQEQLGLKLVAAKASLEVIVIDHVEKPSEN